MLKYHLIIIFCLIQIHCGKKDKWKALPLNIKKQESYNYSEMISGKLDSATKMEFEEVKKTISDKNKLDIKKSKSGVTFFDKIKNLINNIINWIKNIF